MRRLSVLTAALLLVASWAAAQTVSDRSVSATLTATCTNANTSCNSTAGSTLETPTVLYATATVTISGTYTGSTVNFEVSDDFGATWYPTQCSRFDNGVIEQNEAVASNAFRVWSCGTYATTRIRIRQSALSTGSPRAVILQSVAAIEPAQSSIVHGTPTGTTASVPIAVDTTGRLQMAGGAAAGAALAGNPVIAGVSDGTNAQTLSTSCNTPGTQLQTSVTAMSGTTAAQIIALAAGKRVYICNTVLATAGGTSPTFSLQYGTGTNCAVGTTTFIPAITIPVANAAPQQWTGQFVVPAGNAVCYLLTGTTPTGTLTMTFLQQ